MHPQLVILLTAQKFCVYIMRSMLIVASETSKTFAVFNCSNTGLWVQIPFRL